jgi:DNA-binding transcriptional regulator YiaG
MCKEALSHGFSEFMGHGESSGGSKLKAVDAKRNGISKIQRKNPTNIREMRYKYRMSHDGMSTSRSERCQE